MYGMKDTETERIFEKCAKFARDGIIVALAMPILRDEMINVGATAIDNGRIKQFATSVVKSHADRPELRDKFCTVTGITVDEFDLMVTGLFQTAVWLNLVSVSVKRAQTLDGFMEFAAEMSSEDSEE